MTLNCRDIERTLEGPWLTHQFSSGGRSKHATPRTYRTVLNACVRQWGQIITRNLRGETEKYAGVGGSSQFDFINIKISSNRVMGYVYICIILLKYVLTTICICNHFPPAPYKQYCPTIVIVYVCPQIYANDST